LPTAIPVALAVLVTTGFSSRLDLAVVIGLGIFGFTFAVVSSLHSYLAGTCMGIFLSSEFYHARS
jgi:hypothetical protein